MHQKKSALPYDALIMFTNADILYRTQVNIIAVACLSKSVHNLDTREYILMLALDGMTAGRVKE